LFDAADSAFSVDLNGQETAELRRWLVGAEGRTSRARGLKRRVEDLILDDADAQAAIDAVQVAARALPGDGWPHRVNDGQPRGPTERFLAFVRQQVRARADSQGAVSSETDTSAPVPGLLEAAQQLDAQLERLVAPLATLRKRLLARLDDE